MLNVRVITSAFTSISFVVMRALRHSLNELVVGDVDEPMSNVYALVRVRFCVRAVYSPLNVYEHVSSVCTLVRYLANE